MVRGRVEQSGISASRRAISASRDRMPPPGAERRDPAGVPYKQMNAIQANSPRTASAADRERMAAAPEERNRGSGTVMMARDDR